MKKYKVKKTTLIIVFLSIALLIVFVYAAVHETNRQARERCLLEIEYAASQARDRLQSEMRDRQNDLTLLAEMMMDDNDLSEVSQQSVMDNLGAGTNFSGIEIVWSDGRMQSSGKLPKERGGAERFGQDAENVPYVKEMLVEGEFRDNQFICQAVPVTANGELRAILYGYITLEQLAEYTITESFNGNALINLVNRIDGMQMVDEFHRYDADGNELPLSEIYSFHTRKTKYGYTWEKANEQIARGKPGFIVYTSRSMGTDFYTYFQPAGINDWIILITVGSNVALASYRGVQRTMLLLAGGILLLAIGIIISITVQYRENRQAYQDIAEKERRASQAKTDFLSRMSHDIRTPINGIVGMIHIIEKEQDRPEIVKESIEKMKLLSKQLEILINDVLEMSRIENGKTKLSHEPFNLQETLQGIKPAIESMAEDRGIRLKGEHVEIKHPYVVGSPSHIQRIFMNILSNAVKYNRQGGTIECWLKETKIDKNHSNYEFTVKDTGIGMSPEFLTKLFEPFAREEQDGSKSESGTGLGMAITKELVEKHGGTIQVQSELGVGTTCVLNIPFELCNEVAKSVPETGKNLWKGKKILLVDDNKVNLEVIRFMLEEEDVSIAIAGNGKEAVEEFTSQSPGTYDLILMDIMMPEMDGLEATRAIRGLERPDAGKIPIVALTANAFEEDVRTCIEAGMNDHIAKPVDQEVLIATIAKYLI